MRDGLDMTCARHHNKLSEEVLMQRSEAPQYADRRGIDAAEQDTTTRCKKRYSCSGARQHDTLTEEVFMQQSEVPRHAARRGIDAAERFLHKRVFGHHLRSADTKRRWKRQ